MRALHAMFGVLLMGLLLIGSTWTIVAYLQMDTNNWNEAAELVRHGHRPLLYAAIVLLVLTLLFLLSGSRTLADREQFLSFDQEGGSVNISVKAIGDFLARLSEEYAAILTLKPSIKVIDDQLDVEVDLRIRAGSKIPELSQILQMRIKEVIQDNLGVAGVRSIRINVRDIVGGSERSAPSNTTEV